MPRRPRSYFYGRTGGSAQRRASSRRAAFTLIELMVSIVVLTLLVVMVTQLINGASATTNLQRLQLDANRQARLVFDRMASDFAGMVRRSDVDCTAYKYPNYRTGGTTHFKRTGNDSLLFFAQADSQSAGSTLTGGADSISLVGYRIFDRTTGTDGVSTGTPATAAQSMDASFKLERLGKSFGWSEGTENPAFGLPFLTFSGADVVKNSTITTYWPFADTYNTAGLNAGDVPESHVLGEDVFRLEFALLMKDDQGSNTYFLKSDGQNSAYLDYTLPQHRAFKGVSAIVVTIAMLDRESRLRLGSGDALYQTMSTVAAKLVDSDTADAATLWTAALLNKTNDAAIPRVFTTNSHVYQRYFYLR